MSSSATWRLPVHEVARSRIDAALTTTAITIDSNDAQNRSCWMALGDIAGELSMKLGGPDEPEPS